MIHGIITMPNGASAEVLTPLISKPEGVSSLKLFFKTITAPVNVVTMTGFTHDFSADGKTDVMDMAIFGAETDNVEVDMGPGFAFVFGVGIINKFNADVTAGVYWQIVKAPSKKSKIGLLPSGDPGGDWVVEYWGEWIR